MAWYRAVAQWSSHSSEKQKIRVRIPAGLRLFRFPVYGFSGFHFTAFPVSGLRLFRENFAI
jgi:hypothetical protein